MWAILEFCTIKFEKSFYRSKLNPAFERGKDRDNGTLEFRSYCEDNWESPVCLYQESGDTHLGFLWDNIVQFCRF